ncbi:MULTISPECIES: putative toxin-antitoxin system toxin component, PIN family [unclassified Sporolactobacillus]|uniref:putative toxin-antitoxin system toxin component, PIN family n=1 Tax=unclassified Sporolactobacillus TaxID=2628533 RepID=UPI002368EFAC|nr:putative toxin-antitoxin system toxin component, PIN family [Sporolactobacillus sp. CQH2019]MDD9149521.1 putative toxin-antitoxin system toxin component, PIN family [Sporolactobacillus sp. CQH2019]
MADKVIIDTNIFVNAFFKQDTELECLDIISNLQQFNIRLLFSQNTIGELMYVVKRSANSANWDEEAKLNVLRLLADVFYYGKSVNTRHIDKSSLPSIKDHDDDMFIELAYSTETDYLVTMDGKSGMLDLGNAPFKCCTPAEFLQYMR